jgi:hypothetical protein
MSLLKVLVGAAAGVSVVLAFRDGRQGRWLRPALPWDTGQGAGGAATAGEEEYGEEDFIPGEEEPVLGYDGMDRDTLNGWLRSADLDADTLRAIRTYEASHLARQPVLDTVDELLA